MARDGLNLVQDAMVDGQRRLMMFKQAELDLGLITITLLIWSNIQGLYALQSQITHFCWLFNRDWLLMWGTWEPCQSENKWCLSQINPTTWVDAKEGCERMGSFKVHHIMRWKIMLEIVGILLFYSKVRFSFGGLWPSRVLPVLVILRSRTMLLDKLQYT